MASDTSTRRHQPTVEDYHSDESDGHVLSSNFARRASPAAQANVSTKRSKDLSEKTPTDVRSDSGYSSYTAASKSSADSAISPPSPPAAAAAVVAAPPPVASSPAPKPRRPTIADHRHQSHQTSDRSPRPKPPTRTASMSSKQRPAVSRRPTITRQPDMPPDVECQDPKCKTCGPNARPARDSNRRRSTLELPPTVSAQVFANLPSDQVSQRSDPNPYYNHPSPSYSRDPYNQPAAFVQPSRTHERRRSSSTVRPRPQSYAGDPSAGYWVPAMPNPGYPSPPQEPLGPPPSMSMLYQNRNYPNMAPYVSGTPPVGPYYPSPANQISPPYDGSRPPLSARGPSYPQRGHLPPIVTQDGNPSRYSARFGQPPTPSEPVMKAPRQRVLTQAAYNDDDSCSSSEEDEVDEYEMQQRSRVARALMPPPEIPDKRERSRRRPTLTQATTTQAVDQCRQSFVVSEHPKPQSREQREREQDRDRLPRMNTDPPRKKSISRPPLYRESQSEYPARYQNGNAQMIVNNTKSNRRQSYQGPSHDYEKTSEQVRRHQQQVKTRALEEQRQQQQIRAAEQQRQIEQKRARRVSRVHPAERHMPGEFVEDVFEEEEERRPLRPRRKTDAELRKGKERVSEPSTRLETAEEYINSTRGARIPLADSVNKLAKRASRVPSGPSESGSSQSNGSGKQSVSQRTNVTNGANNEIRLRVDASAPIALSFNGDMEGRTLQLLPAENGMTDVVIGNRETTYHDERGTVAGNNRRSIMGSQPRRDAEDLISERSTRSSRSRRERDEARMSRDERGHVLRRSRHTTSYYGD